MATTFRNKVVKDIGTQKIIAITTNASTRSTIIGISLVNTTKGAVSISLLIGDDASSEDYYLEDVLLPPKGSLKPLGPAEKLILAPNNTLLLQSNKADSVDAVLSYVDIV